MTDTSAERRTRWVLGITLAMMAAEIAAGVAYGSLALLADGWHMGTHAAALGIAVFAYGYARRHAADPRFAFGTGKVNALGGFASAVALGVVALLMAVESVQRLVDPRSIAFDEALLVATLGLAVNLVCAWLLREAHHHDHDHVHSHAGATDHNLRAAYAHVLADALTSVLAIVALGLGKLYGWQWLDPVMGLVGGVVISRWALRLARESSRVLLDRDVAPDISARIRARLEEGNDDRVCDLHVWRLGQSFLAAIVSIVTHEPRPPEHYKRQLADFHELKHVTVEVHRCPDHD